MPVMRQRDTIYMMKGLPASGKTTIAREMVRTSPKTTRRVNKDELRCMLQDGKYTEDSEHFVLDVRNYIVSRAIERGYDIIVDDTNMNPKHEESLREIAYSIDAIFEVVRVNTSVEDCIIRDSKRFYPVGEDVIRGMSERYDKEKEEDTTD